MHAFSSHAQIIIDIVPFVRYLIIGRPVINEALWSEQSFISIWNHIKNINRDYEYCINVRFRGQVTWSEFNLIADNVSS